MFTLVHIRITKSKMLKLVGYVKCMADTTKAYTILDGKPEGRCYLGALGVNGTIILKLIFRKYFLRFWAGFN
jgi:hypothetical protein